MVATPLIFNCGENMLRQNNSKAIKEVTKEMAESDERILKLAAELSEAKQYQSRLRKAQKALSDSTAQDSNGRINATLKHVTKAIVAGFGHRSRMQPEQLEKRVVELMTKHNRFSPVGLKLRVQQGLNGLALDSEGFVLCPNTEDSVETKNTPPAA